MSEPDLSEFKHGLIAGKRFYGEDGDPMLAILHFCAYPEPPTEADIASLKHELNTDPEFGLIGQDLVICPAPPSVCAYYLKNDPREANNGEHPTGPGAA